MDPDKCDMCGGPITGEKYPVVNENFQLQRGVYHCGCNFQNLTNSKDKVKPKKTCKN